MLGFGKKDLKIILKDFGEVSYWFSIVFLIPILLILIYQESFENVLYFIVPFLICLVLGYVLKTLFKDYHGSKEVHAFAVITLIWFVLPLIGGLPFFMSTEISFLDGYFESVSALTTTGLSVMSSAPFSVLFWRAFQGWIGGAGIVVLALVGIMHFTKKTKLFKAEMGEEKLKPSIVSTIKTIWWVYTGLTIFGIILLLLANVNVFDAVTMSMDAISTTGTANTMSGLLEFDFWGQAAIAVIMFLGGISFAVHYAFAKKDRLAYFKDIQVKIVTAITLASIFILIPKFVAMYGNAGVFDAVFHVISSITGGGFQTVTMASWDVFTKVWLAMIMIIGASAGSTCGGIKAMRFWILVKGAWWKIKEIILPKNVYFRKTIGNQKITTGEISSVGVFVILYIGLLVLSTLSINYIYGHSIEDVFLEVSSAQANTGITTGISGPGMPAGVQIILIINMIAGRIEIIPILAAVGFLLKMKG